MFIFLIVIGSLFLLFYLLGALAGLIMAIGQTKWYSQLSVHFRRNSEKYLLALIAVGHIALVLILGWRSFGFISLIGIIGFFILCRPIDRETIKMLPVFIFLSPYMGGILFATWVAIGYLSKILNLLFGHFGPNGE